MNGPTYQERYSCSSFLCIFAALFFLFVPVSSLAQTISGTIQDSTGAVIPGARIEITGSNLTQPLVLSTDALGKFSSPPLQPGTYSLKITREGFEPLIETLEIKQSVELQRKLEIVKPKVTISVPAKSTFGNSDPLYLQLRGLGLGDTYKIENFTLSIDVGTFHFDKGTLTILNPVEGVNTGAVFVGEGHFNLKPVTAFDTRELNRRCGATEANEDFTEAVFRFTRDGRGRFAPGLGARTDTPPEAVTAFERWREKMRQRREQPLTMLEYLLHGDDMDNVDADVLAAIDNPAHPSFFNAYIHGKNHKDLRFFVRTRVGAIPSIDSPEEVALINYAEDTAQDGIWYLSHFKQEYENHTASSREDRRLFATHRYKIETVIAKNGHLFSTATITFEPLVPGERILKFGLLPNLRVTRVTDEHGQDLHYIQEGRKQDGSFYAILPEAPPMGKETAITVEYSGDQVLLEAGHGSFYFRARTSWYPNLNGFGEKALYDLTYKVPKNEKMISIGELQSESVEQDMAVTHWVTPYPVAVAGFNYGEYHRVDLPDEATGFKISGYYLTELPSNLKAFGGGAFANSFNMQSSALATLAPSSMTKYALEQTRAQLQLCTHYFGKTPYTEVRITEQPDFSFGQSWPDLVYLPISAYTDSTQRWELFGRYSSSFTGFVQEVTPHEVAHQWWGHAVGWATYHDVWLSEGFAEFSAGLFMQYAFAGDTRHDYIEFWERLRKRILEKNSYGIAPTDAGPLWMGLRLDSPHTESAYQNIVYPKGAYVLQMLRSMMWSSQNHDDQFIAMMHDFVATHQDRAATTESFKAIAERHMTKPMDLEGNGSLDWFFNEWVYGTQVPRYAFNYQVTPAENGQFKLHMTVTQSEVDEHFGMLVPVYADFGKGMLRLGQVPVLGSSTQSVDLMLPIQPKTVSLNPYKEILAR